jgi:outer membrane protein assembly factor BamB
MKPRLHCLRRKVRRMVVLACLPIFLGLIGCLPLSVLSYSEPTPVVVNHVSEEVHGLTQLWSRDDVYVLWENKALDASLGTGCFLGNLGSVLKSNYIICFESETGEIKWRRESALGGKLAMSLRGVFVAYTNSPNALSRYDLQSGNLIWREEWYESNPLYLLFFNNEVQLITMKPGRRLWVFDANGNVIKRMDNTQAFFTTPDVTFFSENGIRAVLTDTNEILWEYIAPAFELMPIFTQDKILCRNESNSGMAYALDQKTGKLLWQVYDIVYRSTLAYSPAKKLVYALRNNGDLLAIDEDTGETSVAAKFSSTPFLFNNAGTPHAYELAYDQEKHILLASLGDGHQLFAFREE